MNNRCYIAIDLKSFFASVECVERNLDPLNTNLVVADENRTDKTICLAVTPTLKSFGISGRPRLYEIKSMVNKINKKRLNRIKEFSGKSVNYNELMQNNTLELDYIVAKPQMSKYIEYSSRIYEIYLRYVSKDDIHVYSIDEVFIDATSYLKLYNKNAHDFTMMLIKEVLKETKITATAGIGTNLYLAKIAMDIVAKKSKPDKDGVRIAFLTEKKYKKIMWEHTPIKDFWRVGSGTAKTLEKNKMYTMGDIALKSITNENLLYDLFGKNAELLIDHAWGIETCTIEDIKAYKPSTNSIGISQVLDRPYKSNEAYLIVKEMVESLVLDLVSKNYMTNKISMHISYDIENIASYDGTVEIDMYGRTLPKSSKGYINLEQYTCSTKIIKEKFLELFNNITKKNLTIRKLGITLNKIKKTEEILENNSIQLDIFTILDEKKSKLKFEFEKKEKDIQKTIIDIKNKYGKNSLLKANNLEKNSTAKKRNKSIGGHNA